MLGTLSGKQIEALLYKSVFGRIGCCDQGKMYVVPINFVYDGKDIIGHSLFGMKIQMMRSNPAVCFEVDEIKDFTNWKSVIIWGEYQEIDDPGERYRAMKYFVDRTMEIKMSETSAPPDISPHHPHPRLGGSMRPIVYRIVILEKTGRYESE